MQHGITHGIRSREISELPLRSKSHRQLYGNRSFIDDLDIVNELGGHSGCVNALSWSKSGQLLASGSDDQHLHIHRFQPEDADSQFKFATTVATGHTANIFSVKFMPHSNDRTVVTAAGDTEVRVFDLEYSGPTTTPSQASANAMEGRRRRRRNDYDGVRYLNDGNTNIRVYRSHGDRVKRIVTESSPHLFLTCSEDGEVRQWDLRQPSSAYPAPRGRNDESLPSPLISYKRYQLDLNSISCSASQPHYIALGGAHLHALLHDRRMAGRDRLGEAGRPITSSKTMTADEEEAMTEATRCVRKFAPEGQAKMPRTGNGHITALKISDVRPNEMVASWSGDHIYSFDLTSPSVDAQQSDSPIGSPGSNRVRESEDRKRKRRTTTSDTSQGQTWARRSLRQKTAASTTTSQGTALRVRYQNGQSEDIPLPEAGHSEQTTRTVRLTEQEKNADRIAKAVTRVRSSLLGASGEAQAANSQFSSALGHAAAILGDIDEEIRGWRYPMEPDDTMVRLQQTLRSNRESVRRFVQAAGTLARVLGGTLQTPSRSSPLLAPFANIEMRNSDLTHDREEQFGYDFIKAITLWLESGVGRLIEGFTRPEEMPLDIKAARRLPIPAAEASTEAIDEYLIPYLLCLADDKPVTNLDANRFELDQNTRLFTNEKAAVLAFAQAVKIPFADLSSAVSHAEGTEHIQSQDRQTAIRFWAGKAARGVLINAAEGVNFTLTSRAFGGLGRVVREIAIEEESLEPVDADAVEENVLGIEVLDPDGTVTDGANAEDLAAATTAANAMRSESVHRHESDVDTDGSALNESETWPMNLDDTNAEDGGGDDDDDNEDGDEDADIYDDSNDDEEDATDDDASSEASEEDGVPNLGLPRFMYASATERRRLRSKVAAGVPCSSAVRTYRGHCNVKTVKDVNYFGLDDEYVVSGSDDGNVFIWDRKTCELVNILNGDGEVVNVIQGHPYEPMMAVSGIDHTIKIFSPDARARESARLSRGVTAHDSTEFSSLAWPARIGRRRVSRRSDSNSNTTGTASEPAFARSQLIDEGDDTYVAEGGLASRRRMQDSYRIVNQNDVERRNGSSDAFITLPPRSHILALLLGGGLGNMGLGPAFD